MLHHTLFNQRVRVEYCDSATDPLGELQESWHEYGWIWASLRRVAVTGRHHLEHFRLRVRSQTHLPKTIRFLWGERVLIPLTPPIREERRPWVDWVVENQSWSIQRTSHTEPMSPHSQTTTIMPRGGTS